MKKRFIAIFLLALIPSIAFSADFRNVSWGMSKEEVMAVETGKFIKVLEDDEELGYESIKYEVKLLDKYKYVLEYIFIRGELACAIYGPINDRSVSTNEWRYIKMTMLRIYGEPKKIDDTGLLGVDSTVSRDYRYHTNNTRIQLKYFSMKRLSLPNKIFISYYSKKHKMLYDEIRKKRQRKKGGGDL